MDSNLTEEVFKTICAEIATSSIGLAKICKSNGVHTQRFYEAIRDNLEWQDIYTRAREEQADFMADEIIEIADFSAKDTITTEKGEYPDREWIDRSKLRVEARKWIAAKLKPKKYGDKVDLTTGGEKLSIAPIIKVLPKKDE